MTPHTDLEIRLQAMARMERAPLPDSAVIEAALARRARGDRHPLPTDHRGIPRLWRLAGIAAMLVVSVSFWLHRSSGREQPGTESSLSMSVSAPGEPLQFLLPGPLLGQATSTPQYPVVDRAPGLRLTPGRWFYTRDRHDAINDTLMAFGVERSRYDDKDSWLFLAGTRAPRGTVSWSDTTWLSRESLRPYARVRYPRAGTRIEETWRADDVLIGESHNGFTSWSTTSLHNPNAMLSAGEVIHWYQIFARLLTEPLSPTWKGSMALVANEPKDSSNVFFNLAVAREEVVSVPAGSFDCWKVGIGQEGNGFFFWVSKKQGWIVAIGGERKGQRTIEQALVSGEDLP